MKELAYLPDDQSHPTIDNLDDRIYKLTREQFKAFIGPGIYVVQTKSEMLYIGSAKNLSSRTSDTAHSSLRAAIEFADSSVYFISTISEKQARDLEAGMIAKYQPKLNIMGKSAKNGS